jgi:CheY-like chemotaxis protein
VERQATNFVVDFRKMSLVAERESGVEPKGGRILVIDDEPIMADSLRQNLIEEGYAVDTAADGVEAIEQFDLGGHHLAICDLQLPDMDGLEVLRHIKDLRPSTEVIVVTGYGTVARTLARCCLWLKRRSSGAI